MQSSGVGALGTPLANLDAELEQFATDARRAQKRAGKVSSGGAGRGFRHSSWVVRYGAIVRTSRCTFAVPFDHGRPRGRMQ